jgi:CubicO group peptidase (beta-lactamase class C family)
MLVEEGKISINDPVSLFIPEYAHTMVASRADSGRTLVPARRQITIKDLLTHTAGISYGQESFIAERYTAKGLGNGTGLGFYTADKDEPVCTTMERLASLPFIAQPGEAFVYGYNTDILGCVVEHVSKQPLDEFVRTRITAPLGMNDTYYFLDRPSARDSSPCTPATALDTPSARRTVGWARATTSTDRGATSPAGRECSPPRTTTRAFSRWCSTTASSMASASSRPR